MSEEETTETSEASESEGEQEGDVSFGTETDYLGQCSAKCPKCLSDFSCTLGSKHADDGFPHSCPNHHTW